MNPAEPCHDSETREAAPRQEGFTLIELVVAMGVFSVFLGIFLTSTIVLMHTTTDARVDAVSSSQISTALGRVDRSIRYASSVNFPGKGATGTATYIEWLTAAGISTTGLDTCTQLRYDPLSQTLALRTWTAGSTPANTWSTILTDLLTSPAGYTGTTYPFHLIPAVSGTTNYQGVQFTLRVGQSTQAGTTAINSYYARNSSVESQSNTDANGDGASDLPICNDTGYRP